MATAHGTMLAGLHQEIEAEPLIVSVRDLLGTGGALAGTRDTPAGIPGVRFGCAAACRGGVVAPADRARYRDRTVVVLVVDVDPDEYPAVVPVSVPVMVPMVRAMAVMVTVPGLQKIGVGVCGCVAERGSGSCDDD